MGIVLIIVIITIFTVFFYFVIKDQYQSYIWSKQMSELTRLISIAETQEELGKLRGLVDKMYKIASNR